MAQTSRPVLAGADSSALTAAASPFVHSQSSATIRLRQIAAFSALSRESVSEKLTIIPKMDEPEFSHDMPSDPTQNASAKTQGEETLSQRFSGTVIGAAIGDALAFPHQHYSRSFLTSLIQDLDSEFSQHHSGFYPAGQYGADTQVTLAVLEAIVEGSLPDSTGDGPPADGDEEASAEFDAARFLRYLLPLWRDQTLIEGDASSAEALGRVLSSNRPWCPQPLAAGRAEVSPVGRVLCVALWNHDAPEALSHHVETLVRLTHEDTRTLACAAAFAAALAHNVTRNELILGPFLDDVAHAAGRFDEHIEEVILDFPRTLSMTEFRALRHIETRYADPQYPVNEDGIGLYCVPSLLCAIYYFLKTPYAYNAVARNALRLGGQNATTVFIAGALSGSLVGLDGLPTSLRQNVLGSSDLLRQAENLYRTWRS